MSEYINKEKLLGWLRAEVGHRDSETVWSYGSTWENDDFDY